MLKKRNYLELILIKVTGNLKTENSRDYLSYLWWIIEPVLQMVTYYIVFGVLLKRGTENYVAFLLTGLIPWFWFNRSINRSTMSIISGRALIMQVYIPKIIFPTIVVCHDTVKQTIIFVLLILFLIFYGIQPSIHWLSMPLLALTQLLLIFACSYFVAAIIPFVQDFRFLIATGLHMLFFFSGVFFTIEVIPPRLQKFFLLNPMASILHNYREVLLYKHWPDWWAMLSISSGSIIVICLMFIVIKYLDHVYPRIIL